MQFFPQRFIFSPKKNFAERMTICGKQTATVDGNG
jgi:hypothetical protein